MVSTCWITNIHYVSDSLYATIPAKRVKGYVQSCEPDQNLLINLHSEQQLKALGKIPLAERIMHTDATGGLNMIPKHLRDYGQIMNYFMVVKDASDLNKRSLVVNESISSMQSTFGIKRMFDQFIENFRKLHSSQNAIFQLVVCDLSWATIHAVLQCFNLELINLKIMKS